ncbi:hypothetical protein [Desulfitobacterium chlororespirans]|uniref:Uncharacterized protein n=1 Tax=Desulfitobacterium chlororespirans DSM 11544 TaxID=1121395 RepID=A0A1M7U3T4_9FIRM|nr:hypothetical protein [Desulfitobacterium chlororespirans]SHN77615.1 hypothetical protein SAMN02745215_02912 [Desulfitobacterium chlororespirans DSM 11544]
MATDKKVELQRIVSKMSAYGVTPETIVERRKALEVQILRNLKNSSAIREAR